MKYQKYPPKDVFPQFSQPANQPTANHMKRSSFQSPSIDFDQLRQTTPSLEHVLDSFFFSERCCDIQMLTKNVVVFIPTSPWLRETPPPHQNSCFNPIIEPPIWLSQSSYIRVNLILWNISDSWWSERLNISWGGGIKKEISFAYARDQNQLFEFSVVWFSSMLSSLHCVVWCIYFQAK